ncbi:sensor histidine kinase [Pseudoduganella violaceinigra]|uniref:sensor histidine kinase n=1 Tax=Pseudoduganella violaceinigra TaxID=246602 RepID=UPI0004236C71|nr:ATP-binding protein [Pseudoduganella violaceinigra]
MARAAQLPGSSYEKELSAYHLVSSRACAVTVLVLVLLGMVLDFAIYPEQMLRFAIARVLTAAAILAALALLYTRLGRRYVHLITFTWLTFPQLMIAWMINVTQGTDSLFYAGIILTIFAVGTLFPVGYLYTLGFGLFTMVAYYLACALRAEGVGDAGQFLFHLTIIAFSVAGSTVYTYYNERGRRQLHALKEEVARKNLELEANNRSLAEIKGQMLQQEKMAALGTLAAGLLHEVNNPVNFCMMAIDIALEEPGAKSSDVLHECLTDAKSGMQRVQYIVSDLKTFAYRKSGADHESAQFLLERALESAVRLVGHEIKGVQVNRHLDADTLVRGDEAAIIGVLINLFSNAALAMRKGGTRAPAIDVHAEARGERLHVTVRDNGPGIAPENLGRVFEPFFTTREVGQGLGLGLSICYSVIQRHGGLLAADSAPGEWTAFSFDLPRVAGGEA